MANLKDLLTDRLRVLEGATNTTDGKSGIVPKPLAGDQNKILTADGTFKTVTGGSGGSVFVFDPDNALTPGDDIFTDFGDLVDALPDSLYSSTIYVHKPGFSGTINIPAGSYDLKGCVLKTTDMLGTFIPSIEFADGTTITNFPRRIEAIRLVFQNDGVTNYVSDFSGFLELVNAELVVSDPVNKASVLNIVGAAGIYVEHHFDGTCLGIKAVRVGSGNVLQLISSGGNNRTLSDVEVIDVDGGSLTIQHAGNTGKSTILVNTQNKLLNSAGVLYLVDSASQNPNPVRVVLPPQPYEGYSVSVLDFTGDADTYPIEIDPQTTGRIAGGPLDESLFMDIPRGLVRLTYVGGTYGWVVE